MLSRRRVVLAVGLHQSTATATAGYLAVRRRWQRTTLPLGARVGGVVSTTGGRMVVTQYRLLVVSLRVLVGKDTPGGGSGVVVVGVPHPASLRVERRSGPGSLGLFPPT